LEGGLTRLESSGQADANGEFMFGTGYVWRPKNGEPIFVLAVGDAA